MLIRVKVFPESNKEEILEESKDSFIVRIKEKPFKGKATQKTREVLANYFNIKVSEVKLVKGGRSRRKIFEITF